MPQPPRRSAMPTSGLPNAARIRDLYADALRRDCHRRSTRWRPTGSLTRSTASGARVLDLAGDGLGRHGPPIPTGVATASTSTPLPRDLTGKSRGKGTEGRKPAAAGFPGSGRGGFRTRDLSRVKQRGASALRAFMPGNQPHRMPRTVIGSSPIRSSTAAFGPTIGPTEESASCRRRLVCSVNAHAQRSACWLSIRPPEPAGVEPPVSCVVVLEEEVVSEQHISKRAGNGFR